MSDLGRSSGSTAAAVDSAPRSLPRPPSRTAIGSVGETPSSRRKPQRGAPSSHAGTDSAELRAAARPAAARGAACPAVLRDSPFSRATERCALAQAAARASERERSKGGLGHHYYTQKHHFSPGRRARRRTARAAAAPARVQTRAPYPLPKPAHWPPETAPWTICFRCAGRRPPGQGSAHLRAQRWYKTHAQTGEVAPKAAAKALHTPGWSRGGGQRRGG